MRFGINGTGLVQRASIDAVAEHAAAAAADGFTSYSLAEHPTGGFDALTVLTVVGQRVPNIELGNRHRADDAAASDGAGRTGANDERGHRRTADARHRAVARTDDGAARHRLRQADPPSARVSVGADAAARRKAKCRSKAKRSAARRSSSTSAERRCSVVVAALGPQALTVAGARTDGTTLAWVGPRTIREHIVPTISAAAEAAGRPSPRIIATLPVCVTNEVAKVRSLIDKTLTMYGQLPSYRAMFDREGVTGPSDIALVGDEDAVLKMLDALRTAGVTDFAASEFTPSPEERVRTRALLKSVAA